MFEPDQEIGGYVVRITPLQFAPARLSAIAADAAHNLRAALDILWRLALHGNSPTARGAHFPIFDTAKEFEARKWGEPQRPNVRKAVDLLKAAKPYKGGNDALWALDAIDTRDKHEMLMLTVGTFRSLLIRAYPDTTILMKREDFVAPVEDGTLMCRLGGEFTSVPVEMQHEFVFEVTFGQGEALEGEPILPALHQMAEAVDSLVEAFLTAGLLP